ncbi:Redoxin-domain-containing protein [Daedaleopsis nitida]|nr:Redoxin-domain-containing protein [Daedaleopsis nitida]
MLAFVAGTRLQSDLLRCSLVPRLTAVPCAQGKRLLTTSSRRHVTSLRSFTGYKDSLTATHTALRSRNYAASNNSSMSDINVKVGDTIPQGAFTYIPWSPELEDNAVCGLPVTLNTDEWKGKKVVLVSVPGAFTRLCHSEHLPPFVKKIDEFKAKGVDVVAVVAANDAFVMSGWARFTGLKDKILPLSDPNAKWSSELGLSQDLSAMGWGTRTKRYALVIDDLRVTYVGVETERKVSVSGADAVLAAL